MATKIYLVGQNVHIEKGSITFVRPMSGLFYDLTNSVLSIYFEGKYILHDASNVIKNIDNVTMANDSTIHAYLGQFMGAKDIQSGSNATLTSLASVATTSTLLLAANEHRTKVLVFNNSTSTLYLKFGTAASATSFTYKVIAASTAPLEITDYKGVMYFFHSALNGKIEVTEIHI